MFRFTIRDLLWLAVVASLAAMVWRAHQEQLAMKEQLLRRTDQYATVAFLIEEEGYRVEEQDNSIVLRLPNGGFNSEWLQFSRPCIFSNPLR